MGNPEDQPTAQAVPPEVRGYIVRMEELMMLRQYNHGGFPVQLAVHLGKRGLIDSFAQFETVLRQLGSRVYFIAVPLDYYVASDEGVQLRTVYPFGHEGEDPEYTLYTAVNGAQDASDMLARLSITAGENLHRLETTGILSIDNGTK